MEWMQAAVFKGPGQMEIETLPAPQCPDPGVLIRVRFCGICGSDVRNFSNGLKDGVTNQIMGHEAVGEIVGGDLGGAPAHPPPPQRAPHPQKTTNPGK